MYDYRNYPWGSAWSLSSQHDHKVRRVFVSGGRQTDLQSHGHRTEIFIVVDGYGCIWVDGEPREMHRDDVFYIAPGAEYQIENWRSGANPMELVEVQLATSYDGCREDDITRVEDNDRRV